jgi:hypothetical protein
MKTRILNGMLWSCALAVAVSTAGPAGAQAADAASLIPAQALMCIHTADTARAISLAAYVMESFAAMGGAEEAKAWLSGFRSRTGVDLLDAASMARAGVDTARPVLMALVPGALKEKRFMILVPVTGDKEAPLALVNLVKKFHADKQGMDLNPAITMYQSVALYQMAKDVFFAGTDGYLVITSSESLIKESIGLRGIDPSRALAGDPVFREYRASAAPRDDVNLFFRGAFFSEVNREEGSDSGTVVPRKKAGKSAKGRRQQGEMIEEDAPSDVNRDARAALDGAGLDGMDYVTAGLSRTGQELSLSLGASPKKGSGGEQVMRTLFRPGIPANLLPAADPAAYLYLSLNLRGLDDACGKGLAAFAGMCGEYKKSLASFDKDTGIDLQNDFVKRFEGWINIAVKPAATAGAMDTFTLLLPMHDAQSASSLWKKFRALGRKNPDKNNTGDASFPSAETFWFADEKAGRVYIAAAGKNLYFSNDQGMLEAALSGREGFLATAPTGAVRNLDASVFMAGYLNLRSESWLRAMILLGSFGAGPQAAGLLNRLQGLSMTGRMAGAYVSLRLDLSIASGARQ